jgi:hypothetical protein
VTGITLSEAWKRMPKAPRPPLRTGLSPNRAALAQEHHYRLRCLPGKSRMAWSSASGKNIPLRRTTPAIPHPLEGRIAIVTDVGCGMRWTRQRRARTGSQGGLWPVSDQPARRRTALKRLRQNFGRQHMSWSKRFGGGSRGRQKRVVLAPVAGVKLMEILEAQPGVGESSIHQRRWQEEFVAGESAP